MADKSRIYVNLPEKVTPSRPTNINEFFDRIYVLNLDRRPDRWQRIKAQADKHGINIQRFSGVDGSQEPYKSEWENYFRQDLVSSPEGIRKVSSSFEYNLDYDSDMARVAYLENRNQKKAIQSPGAWGYLHTMIKILEEAIKEDLDSILVLDDDAIFHKNINDLFKKYIQQVSDDWKIIQLGTLQYHWDEKWITWLTDNVYSCNGSSIASHAVGMHNTVYPLLLNYCYRFDMSYDEGPLHKAKRVFADQSFTIYPNLIIQDTRESEINSSEVQKDEGQKKDNVYRWNLTEYEFEQTYEEKASLPKDFLAIDKSIPRTLTNDARKEVLFDNLNTSWHGWFGVQKVKLGSRGNIESLQSHSTPGIAKQGLQLEPSTFYRFSVTGSFQPKNEKVYWIVTDPDSQVDLCPVKYFSGIFTGSSSAQVTFRTLQKTKRVNVKFVIEHPYEGDKLTIETIKLEAIPIEEAFSTALLSESIHRDGEVIASFSLHPPKSLYVA